MAQRGDAPLPDALAAGELRTRRRALGLTQAELGAALRVSSNTIARWERGDLAIGNPGLTRLALERLQTKDLDQPVRDLPRPLSSFVGRQKQLKLITRHLSSNRLVTLTGPGGVGKTRLALRIAERFRARFRDGVAFVPLADLTDVRLVPQAIAEAINIADVGQIANADGLIQHLRKRDLLLVLDNFEHLVDAAPFVAQLLLACHHLNVLVTSRTPLRISGELVFKVPPLDASESACLLVERAGLVNPGFARACDDAVIVEICRRLDGLPLAIELAAAQARSLSARELLSRMEPSLNVLVAGPRDAPARQRTMRGTIAWSHHILPTNEQRVLRRLAVFRGAFTLNAALAVAADPGEPASEIESALTALVDHALVQVIHQANANARFTLLETMREFGHEQLERTHEANEIHQRHAEYYLSLVRALAPTAQTYSLARALTHMDVGFELDNIRSAFRWAMTSGRADLAFDLAEQSQGAFQVGGYYAETRRRSAELLALDALRPSDAGRRVRLLLADARAADRLADLGEAHARCAEALEIARELGERTLVAAALYESGINAEHRGDFGASRELNEEALAVCRALQDRWGESQNLHALTWLDIQEERFAQAHTRALENVALGRRLESTHATAIALKDLAYAALGLGVPTEAEDALEQALACAEQVGSRWLSSTVLEGFGHAALAQDTAAVARGWFNKSLEVCREVGERRAIIRCLEGLARVDAIEHEPQRALTLIGACAGFREQLGLQVSPRERRLLDRACQLATTRLGTPSCDALMRRGRLLAIEDAMALVAHGPERSRRASSKTGGPTTREMEVAELVAEGLTNPQIAVRLTLGARTVQTHVGHLLDKLGLTTRSQIAAWVAQSSTRPPVRSASLSPPSGG